MSDIDNAKQICAAFCRRLVEDGESDNLRPSERAAIAALLCSDPSTVTGTVVRSIALFA